MAINNDTLKQQLASRAAAASSGVRGASGGAPPAGGPQGVFDASNDGVTYHPTVRLRAGSGTAFVTVNGETTISAANLGATEYATQAIFRASTPPADGTVFRIVSPPGEYRYSTSSGAGWADDGDTILKPDSVILGANGRAFTTRASAHAATFTAARAMKGLLVSGVKHVHIESHTTFGDGGGGIFDVKSNTGSAYASDDDGTQILVGAAGATGASALIRRDRFTGDTNAKWFGAHGNLSFSLTGSYINPASITGGTNDNAAIIAAAAFAVANKKGLYIPAGIYLFDSTQLHFSRGLRITGDPKRTVIVSRINKPFVIGTLTDFCFEVGIKDIDILCYEDHSGDPEYWVAVDLYATSNSLIDFGGRGWDYNLRSVHESIEGDARGENYLTTFNFRQMSYANGLPFPPKTGVVCHIEGQVNGSTFSCDVSNPVTAGLILKGGLKGNLGSTIVIEDVTCDTCDNAVIIETGGGITIRRIYAESCANSVTIDDAFLVDITNVRGGDVVVTDCQGVGFGESVARLVNVRSQVKNRGASFGQATKSVKSTNVGILSTGHNFEVGLNHRHPVCHHSQLDARNLFANGDFSRWIGSVPWLWRTTPGYSPVFTKCGTGLSNTTKSAGVPYCCRVLGATSGEFYITPPLGDQYLGTTISISIKVKLEAGYAGLCVKGNDPTTFDSASGSRAVNETDDAWIECPDEAGGSNWRLVTFSWVIDQGHCDNGIALQMATNAECDIYLSEFQADFGVAVPRGYVPAREVLGGVVGIKRNGTIEIDSASKPAISVDPITSQALVAGDRATDTTGATGGWRYTGSIWSPILETDVEILKSRLVAATNGKLVRAVIGEDFPDSGTLDTWPAFVGAVCTSVGTGRPTLGALRGRKAGIWSGTTNATGYTFSSSTKELWAVARYDDAIPFTHNVGLISGQTGSGNVNRLLGLNTASALLNDGTVTRDGGVTLTVVQGSSYIWRSTAATTGTDSRQIGCSDSAAVNNWQGAIACALGFSDQLTTEEAETVLALLKWYYGK